MPHVIDLALRAELDHSYGNYLMTNRCRAPIECFRRIARQRGMSPEEFDDWARGKRW